MKRVSKEKTVYEIIYKDKTNDREFMTTMDYDNVEKCVNDFKLYENSNEEVIGILLTETKEIFMPINKL